MENVFYLTHYSPKLFVVNVFPRNTNCPAHRLVAILTELFIYLYILKESVCLKHTLNKHIKIIIARHQEQLI